MRRGLPARRHVPLHACCQYYGMDGQYLGGGFSPLLDGLKKEESARESKVDEEEGGLLWSLMFDCESCGWRRKVDAMMEDGGLEPSARPRM